MSSKKNNIGDLLGKRSANSTGPNNALDVLLGDSATEQSDATDKSNSVTELSNEQLESNAFNNVQRETAATVANNTETTGTAFLKEFEKKSKKQTIEDTHTRQTYLIRNDLLNRLDELAKKQDRGFKTHLVNFALERILDEIDPKK